MRVTLLVAVIAPRTCKIIKNYLGVFEKGENFQQNGIQCVTRVKLLFFHQRQQIVYPGMKKIFPT